MLIQDSVCCRLSLNQRHDQIIYRLFIRRIEADRIYVVIRHVMVCLSYIILKF